MSADLPDTLRGAVDVGGDVSNVTPARLLIGRAGTAYRTSTQLQLRADHAFAKDALNATFSLDESPMKDRPADGHVGFQDEAKSVWYRGVRLRELK